MPSITKPAMANTTTITNLLVLLPLPPSALSHLRAAIPNVHYHPDGKAPLDVLPTIQVIFCSWAGPPGITTLSEVPRLRHLQICTSGIDYAVGHPLVKEILQGDGSVTFSSASGIHSSSIPSYCIAMVINLLHRIDTQLYIGKSERRWAARDEFPSRAGPNYVAKSLRGKTAGLLGYGHLGRETARLLQAFGVNIIAANSSGKATADEGFILPGTGDREGIIPSAYYSSRDPKAFREFLSRSQILICSLPSTPQTAMMLTQTEMDILPEDTIFINVGRGNLLSSDTLLHALNTNLLGAAIDVTDPEPLPSNHPLWSHPNIIITPHLSGDAEGELEMATELLVGSVRRMEKGEKAFNAVKMEKGY